MDHWDDLPDPCGNPDSWGFGDPVCDAPDECCQHEPMYLEMLAWVGAGPDAEERLIEVEMTPTKPKASEVFG